MDRTQIVILVVFALLSFLPFTLAMMFATRRSTREADRRWRERLAGPSEDLEDLILGCEIFAMETPRGPLRDDPEVAHFLDLVRCHEHLAAWKLSVADTVEGLLVHAEYRMGCRGRPVSMDYGYLDEVLAELVRRARLPGAPGAPYR